MGLTMTDELPLNPEQWLAIVNDAVAASGHADEVVVGLETTISGWRVSVLPPIQPADNTPHIDDSVEIG